MKNNKILVLGIVVLFLGAGFITVNATTNDGQPMNTSRVNTFNVTAGQPTQNGTWTLHITVTGTTPSGFPYTGTYTYSIPTHPGMTPAEKAEKMKEKINNHKSSPLRATSSGPNVKVTTSNGNIDKWSSKSTDGQFVHGTYPTLLACSFMGTPTSGTVTVDAGSFLAVTTTNGKTLIQIHNDLTGILMGMGVPTMIDPSGLALYIMAPFPEIGLDSDDDGLASYGVFYLDPGTEPFEVYVSMPETFAGNSGSTVVAEFDICNFIFAPNTYHVTATDLLGWDIDPDDFMTDLMPGENKKYTFDVEIPSAKSGTMNLMNVTATAINMPWIIGSGLVEIYVNNPPDIPDIDGPTKGKTNINYDFYFTTTDPDGDDIYYYVDWGDGTNTGWLPAGSGESINVYHKWTTKATFTIKCKAKDIYDAESDWGTFQFSTPRIISFNPIMKLLERFPHAFPILRQILK